MSQDAAKKQILFVDDEQAILDSFRRALRGERGSWNMTFIDCPKRALKTSLESEFDAVVTDVDMPGMDGLQLLEQLRQADRTRQVPIIVVTGSADRCLKRKALDLGATDLLNKPVELEDLLARLRSALRFKACQDELTRHNERLELIVRERTSQLEASRLDIIWRLGMAAEFRDEDTGNHILRVGYSSREIALRMGLGPELAHQLFLAAPLHDIGKLGIPDSILLKTGKLTEDEWQIMQRHCEIGAAILRERPNMTETRRVLCLKSLDRFDNPILEMAATVAMTHHEKWNGEGYPRGLAKAEIPIVGRIVAISDVYDALTSHRPYKTAWPHDEAMAYIESNVGQHFDPEVYSAFSLCVEQFVENRDELSHQNDLASETNADLDSTCAVVN